MLQVYRMCRLMKFRGKEGREDGRRKTGKLNWVTQSYLRSSTPRRGVARMCVRVSLLHYSGGGLRAHGTINYRF